MGVEYSSECYCGNKINSAQGAAPVTDGRCKMPCAGDSSELCGGSYGLNLYVAGQGNQYLGCAVDQSARTLNGPNTASNDMTPDKCLAFCGTGYPLAGVEYGTECYCGGPDVKVGASGCATPCGGDKSQTCGGTWRLSVYNNTNYFPAVAKSGISGYTYRGCYQDTNQRVLAGYVTGGSGNTQETCVAACKSRGYRVAGVEYGRECWCGGSVPPTKAPEGDCNMVCAGDQGELCGGSLRLGVFAL